MRDWVLALVGILGLAGVSHAGDIVFAMDYPLAQYPGTRFLLRITTLVQGKPTATERAVELLPDATCQRFPDPLRKPESICFQVCLDPGDYSLRVRTAGSDPSEGTNLLDMDLTTTRPCQPPRPVPPLPPPQAPRPMPAPTASPVAPIIGGGAVVVGTIAAQGMPSLPGLVNLGCVSWKITGVCLCNPTTPCVTIEYWEPAFLVETVKRPATTALPLIGGLLQTVLTALGAPSFGGGGAGNATGSGHTNLFYSEAHVVSFPNLFGGPCSVCAPQPPLGTLHYASEADAATWRTATAVPSPLDLVRTVGTWGRLYPRGGKVIGSSEPVASALTAVRALSIAHLPIAEPPNVEVHVVAQPIPQPSSCLQMAYPAQRPCMPPGFPQALWEHGTGSVTGTYVFLEWRKRSCCVNPAQTTCGITLLGGQGQNLCLLPTIPTP